MSKIEKVNLANCLNNLESLFNYTQAWSGLKYEFRIDGVGDISPANPSQWLFFLIDNFELKSFNGEEITGRSCNGTDWNGIYYLAGGTRSVAVKFFINLHKEFSGDPNKIFELAYTKDKEGYPNKRRIELRGFNKPGWNCQKYKNTVR